MNLDSLFGQNDRASLDFVREVRASERNTRPAMVRADYAARADALRADGRGAPTTLDDLDSLLARSTVWQFDRALYRFGQEQMYGRIRETMLPHAQDLLGSLERRATTLGSLRLNPELSPPAYYAVDYHAQPGGMDRDGLIGFITQKSNLVYWGGHNDGLALFRKAIDEAPRGAWRRILDMGCGSKSIFAVKAAYPDAEVHGIDLSAPLLRYAHAAAEDAGVALHLSQQDAAHTDFPDGSFDLVFSVLLFHEVPDSAAAAIAAESFRLTAPGGWTVIADGTPDRCLDPLARYLADWPTQHIVEPYLRAAQKRDYREILRTAGFADVSDTSDDREVNRYVFPYITRGRKPDR